MGNSTLDIHLHDTYFVIRGFHYAFLLPLIMLVLPVIYYLLESKVSVNRILGRLHFWVTFIGLWYLLWPGTYEVLTVMPRRYLDFRYSHGFNRFLDVNETMVIVAMVVVITQMIFVGMLVYGLVRWRKAPVK